MMFAAVPLFLPLMRRIRLEDVSRRSGGERVEGAPVEEGAL